MPDPIERPPTPPSPPVSIDAAMRRVTDAREDVHIDTPIPEAEEGSSPAAAFARDLAVESLEHQIYAAAPSVGRMVLGPSALAFSIVATPLEMIAQWNEAHEEGDRRNRVFHQRRMIGALAYFAGYGHSSATDSLAGDDIAFREGLRRAEQFATRTDNVEDALSIVHVVRPAALEGERAVALGLEGRPETDDRLREDPAFRIGVDFMHALRDADPDAYRERVAAIEREARSADEHRLAEIRP